jgi:hypothetical protein
MRVVLPTQSLAAADGANLLEGAAVSEQLDELGRSVTRAARFLWGFFNEVGQLVEELDAVMSERGWQPTEKGRVTYGLTNANYPDGWLADYVFRFFVPHPSSAAAFRTVFGVVVRFDPPGSYDQPVVLAVRAEYPLPTDWNTLFQNWEGSDIPIDGLAATPGPRPLTPGETKTFLPSTSSVNGLVVPLCQLANADDLRTRVINPLLATTPAT